MSKSAYSIGDMVRVRWQASELDVFILSVKEDHFLASSVDGRGEFVRRHRWEDIIASNNLTLGAKSDE